MSWFIKELRGLAVSLLIALLLALLYFKVALPALIGPSSAHGASSGRTLP